MLTQTLWLESPDSLGFLLGQGQGLGQGLGQGQGRGAGQLPPPAWPELQDPGSALPGFLTCFPSLILPPSP